MKDSKAELNGTTEDHFGKRKNPYRLPLANSIAVSKNQNIVWLLKLTKMSRQFDYT